MVVGQRVPVNHVGRTAARAIAVSALGKGGDNHGMVGQPKVVVAAKTQQRARLAAFIADRLMWRAGCVCDAPPARHGALGAFGGGLGESFKQHGSIGGRLGKCILDAYPRSWQTGLPAHFASVLHEEGREIA